MVLITGGLSRTAALCCHRPKHTPASLQITVPLPLLLSYTYSLALLLSTLCTHLSTFASSSSSLRSGYFRVWILVFVLSPLGGQRRGERERRETGYSGWHDDENRIRRMDRGNEISYSLVSANWCGEAGLRWRVIGERIFRARDSVDSSVKYKNDTEGGSKKDIPMKRFLFFFFFFFFSSLFPLLRNDRSKRTYLWLWRAIDWRFGKKVTIASLISSSLRILLRRKKTRLQSTISRRIA